MNLQEKIVETKQNIAVCKEEQNRLDLEEYLKGLLVIEKDKSLNSIKFICSCGKEPNIDEAKEKGFQYSGTDQENNPILQCGTCKDYIWG